MNTTRYLLYHSPFSIRKKRVFRKDVLNCIDTIKNVPGIEIISGYNISAFTALLTCLEDEKNVQNNKESKKYSKGQSR